MASDGTTLSRAGGLPDRYAAALYGLADEARAVDPVTEEMATLGRIIDTSPEFRRLLASPMLDSGEAARAASAVMEAQGIGKMTRDFVGVVATNRRLPQLRNMVSAFAALVAQKRGVVPAAVVSAHPLTDTQRQGLRARLIEAGYGQVTIEERVDPSLLGGIVVRVGARLYDASIKSRLQRLQHAMRGAA